ncbi:MAG: Hint domain-containing protein, partial [Paracoccaceae bacterium]
MLKPIEELNAGDEILTRDAGVQEIRWIGRVTMRASGAFAP